MFQDKDMLQIISNETKDSINNISIVTPSIYDDIFHNFASSHNIDFDEKSITDKIISENLDKFRNLQQLTSKNANKLSKNTAQAIEAIQQKDETALNEIMKKTQELQEEVEKLRESLYKDELTNTFNRKWLHDTFITHKTSNFNTSGFISVVDLNYFKEVNDNYGHIIGDKVLLFIANQLKKTGAKVVRYGGDEFILIFNKNLSVNIIDKKLEALRESMLKKHIKAKNAEFKVSFSYGTHYFNEGNSFAEVIEVADKKMYEDKTNIKKKIKGIKI